MSVSESRVFGLRKWRLRTLLFVAATVACFCGIAWANFSGQSEPRDTLPTAATPRDPAVAVVTVEPLTMRAVERTIDALGTLHGYEEVVLSAKIDGRVRSIHRDVSDRVRPNELLIEFDRVDNELAVQQAERSLLVDLAKLGLDNLPGEDFNVANVPTVLQAQARLDNAEAKFRRGQQLAQSRTLSAEDLDNLASEHRSAKAELANQLLQVKAAVATAQMRRAALAIAKQQLKDTEIRAPSPTFDVPLLEEAVTFSVAQRSVSEGSYVKAGNETCRLVIDKVLKMRAAVPERYSADVRVGQSVSVATAAALKPVVGKVARINPTIDMKTRTFEVEILVPNAKNELKPGSFAKASIVANREQQAVTAPLTALVSFAGITKIFVTENGVAKAVPVKLGVRTAEWVEILSPPLPAGSIVITSGHRTLADGSKIVLRQQP